MKRFAKIILGVLGVLVIVLILALVGINLYLQSGDVQQRIRLATEQALGTPVTVKRTVYTPWSGLTLSGLSLPDPTDPGATLIEAPQFSVRFEFLSLLARRLVISQVTLISPHLVLRQTPEKKWVLVPPRTIPPPSPEKPSEPQSASTIRPPAFTVELREFHIYDGTADIIDHKGATIARVRGISVDGKVLANHRVEGDVWIEDMELASKLFPNRLRAHFVQENDLLSVTDVKCALADGAVRAAFSMVSPCNGSPAFQLKSQVEGVSIPNLIVEAHGESSGTSGTLLGHLELRGNPLDTSTLVGGGEFLLNNAQVRPLDFIRQIGALLHVDELQLLKLREAVLRFEVRDERFWMNDLRLRTENMVITTKGPIKFNGKMNLEGRFQISEKIQHELSWIISDQFIPSAETGYKEVTFTVTGPTDRPKTNLLDKITGYHLGDLGGFGSLLKGFLSVPKSEPPPPSPTETPEKAANN